MIEIPGRLGIIYRRFEPGEIIVPNGDDPVSPIKGESYHQYMDRYTWVVVKTISNDVTVVVHPFGNENYIDEVSSSAYRLATPEEISRAVTKKIRGDLVPTPIPSEGRSVPR